MRHDAWGLPAGRIPKRLRGKTEALATGLREQGLQALHQERPARAQGLVVGELREGAAVRQVPAEARLPHDLGPAEVRGEELPDLRHGGAGPDAQDELQGQAGALDLDPRRPGRPLQAVRVEQPELPAAGQGLRVPEDAGPGPAPGGGREPAVPPDVRPTHAHGDRRLDGAHRGVRRNCDEHSALPGIVARRHHNLHLFRRATLQN
mmetsp:Transcript_92381/g.270433  ORF Transcript_92381/g.270433 Transcript_92381/m.270433 type:complete len:206 (+) Transcript_92381:400-1017(+)